MSVSRGKQKVFTLERIYDMEMFLTSRLVNRDCSFELKTIGICLASLILQKTNQLVSVNSTYSIVSNDFYSALNDKKTRAIRIHLSSKSLLNFNLIYNDWVQFKKQKSIAKDAPLTPLMPAKRFVDKELTANLTCEICKKSLSSKSSLNLHKRVHTDERPHKCYICKDMFRWYTSYKRHIAMHAKAVKKIKISDEISE